MRRLRSTEDTIAPRRGAETSASTADCAEKVSTSASKMSSIGKSRLLQAICRAWMETLTLIIRSSHVLSYAVVEVGIYTSS